MKKTNSRAFRLYADQNLLRALLSFDHWFHELYPHDFRHFSMNLNLSLSLTSLSHYAKRKIHLTYMIKSID
jgi:hypothetical protein